MGFYEELEKTENKTFTENGDIAYRQILKAGEYRHNLAFFGLGGGMRHNRATAVRLFGKAFKENEECAIANLFYLRDCRGGKGERDIFRLCLNYLTNEKPEKVKSLFPFILKYGRGDDLLSLVMIPKTRKDTCDFIAEKIKEDTEAAQAGKNISILAKWLPKPNATSEEKRYAARIIARHLGLRQSIYRKMISDLRKRLALTETALTEGKYDFDYEKVPAQTMIKHSGFSSRYSPNTKNAFLRNDFKRYSVYAEGVTLGKAKVNTAGLIPVQVYKKAFSAGEIAQAQWDEIRKRMPVTDRRIIVVRDGSGSMYGEPLAVATSLSILASECLTGEFKDRFITFSRVPKLVDLSGANTLKDKINVCCRHDDCENTDIEAVYDLILATSKRCNPQDYITNVVIISDMQFDMGTYCYEKGHSANVSTFEKAKAKFKAAGIPFPVMTYWDVAARYVSFPADEIEGVQFVSGYSDAIFKSIVENGTLDAVALLEKTLEPYANVSSAWMAA